MFRRLLEPNFLKENPSSPGILLNFENFLLRCLFASYISWSLIWTAQYFLIFDMVIVVVWAAS